jgi:hypothetical protein
MDLNNKLDKTPTKPKKQASAAYTTPKISLKSSKRRQQDQLKQYAIKAQFQRFQMLRSSTSAHVGPGSYENKKSVFPVCDEKGKLAQEEADKMFLQSTFSSKTPKLVPLKQSKEPSIGLYNFRSSIDDILDKKKIGKMGSFLFNSTKEHNYDNVYG